MILRRLLLMRLLLRRESDLFQVFTDLSWGSVSQAVLYRRASFSVQNALWQPLGTAEPPFPYRMHIKDEAGPKVGFIFCIRLVCLTQLQYFLELESGIEFICSIRS